MLHTEVMLSPGLFLFPAQNPAPEGDESIQPVGQDQVLSVSTDWAKLWRILKPI